MEDRVRILCSKREAASALGISVRTLETLIAVKELKSVRIGRRRMVPQAELERFARRDHATTLSAKQPRNGLGSARADQ